MEEENVSRDIDSMELHPGEHENLDVEANDDNAAPPPYQPVTSPISPPPVNASQDDTLDYSPQVCVLMVELAISAEEADLELRNHNNKVSEVLAARAKRETNSDTDKLKKELAKMSAELKKELEEERVRTLREMKQEQEELKREVSNLHSTVRSLSNNSRQSRQSRSNARKRKSNDRSRDQGMASRVESRERIPPHEPMRASSRGSVRPRGYDEVPHRRESVLDLPPPRPRSREAAPKVADPPMRVRSAIHVLEAEEWEAAGADGGVGVGPWEPMADMDVEDEVDAPDAGAGGGAASSSGTTGRMRLSKLGQGMNLDNWISFCKIMLKAATVPEAQKRAVVLEALLDHHELYSIVESRLASHPAATAVELLTHLGARKRGYTTPRMRRPNWPVFREGGSIRTHAGVMCNEAQDCGASDSTLRAAFLNSLHGRAQTRAKQHFDDHPDITARDLMEHVIGIMEDKETNVDFKLLHSMRPKTDETSDQFGYRLLEEATRILTARGHNASQIEDFCLSIFCSNVNPAIQLNMASASPKTLKEAIATARNLEELIARREAQGAKLAAFGSNRGGYRGRGGHQPNRGRGAYQGRGGQRGGSSGGSSGSSGASSKSKNNDNHDKNYTFEFQGKCYVCREDGHMKKDCPVQKTKMASKNVPRDSTDKESRESQE